MVFIFGGAYQGKVDYAKEHFDIETLCDCSDGRTPDFDSDAICGLEGFSLRCAGEGTEAADFFRENKGLWEDKILICDDVSAGIVSVDTILRSFREINGRLMLYLAGEASEVHRVFCGLGKREK
ncbi:MAG: cobalamin biosynthesis protein CobU [Clostridiales bacterium]|nr:cobalamin biosynthesis protein CobU [Clostridiales bacterium]